MDPDPPPIPPLPPHMDPDAVRAAVIAAVEAAVATMPKDHDDEYWLGRWNPEALAEHAQLIPGLVSLAFPPGGEEVDLSAGVAAIRDLGVQRAREHVARDHVIRLACNASRESLRLYYRELAGSLEPDVLEAVRDRLDRISDVYLSEYLIAFGDEWADVAGEEEPLRGHLLSSTHAGFALGDPDGTIAVANEAFCRFFGRDASPVGRRWQEVMTGDDAAELLAEASAGAATRELKVRDQLGQDHCIRLSLHNRSGRIQAVAVDVTLESEFADFKRELVGGLVHDLRSPLALISGWAQTLDRDGDRLDAATRHEALDTILRAARQLTQMSEHLLELEMLEAGRYPFDPELIDVAARLRALCSLRDADVDAPEELGLHTDAGAFERMVTNLLDNAAAYGVPPVRARVATDGTGVRVEVSDSGSVDPEILALARLGKVPQARGFGLGLRNTILMARAQGGDLEITSAAPTTFTLRLRDGMR